MKKGTILLILIYSFFIGSGTVFGHPEDKPKPAEEFYTEFGYESVGEALKKVEEHFDQSMIIPTRVPALEFTHSFGRFDNLGGDINASFEMKYINEKVPENHYKVDVRPLQHKIPIREKDVLDILPLKNGKDATYLKISGFYVLVFEQAEWQYMLSVDKRVSDNVPPKELVQIANSIYTLNKKEEAK